MVNRFVRRVFKFAFAAFICAPAVFYANTSSQAASTPEPSLLELQEMVEQRITKVISQGIQNPTLYSVVARVTKRSTKNTANKSKYNLPGVGYYYPKGNLPKEINDPAEWIQKISATVLVDKAVEDVVKKWIESVIWNFGGLNKGRDVLVIEAKPEIIVPAKEGAQKEEPKEVPWYKTLLEHLSGLQIFASAFLVFLAIIFFALVFGFRKKQVSAESDVNKTSRDETKVTKKPEAQAPAPVPQTDMLPEMFRPQMSKKAVVENIDIKEASQNATLQMKSFKNMAQSVINEWAYSDDGLVNVIALFDAVGFENCKEVKDGLRWTTLQRIEDYFDKYGVEGIDADKKIYACVQFTNRVSFEAYIKRESSVAFKFLEDLEDKDISTIMMNLSESERSIFLLKLPPTRTTSIIGRVDKDVASGLISSVASQKYLDPKQVKIIEEKAQGFAQSIRSEKMGRGFDDSIEESLGLNYFIKIITGMKPNDAEGFIKNIGATNLELRKKIRESYFVFADIVMLPVKVINMVLANFPTRDFALAILMLHPDKREKILAKLNEYQRVLIDDELGVLVSVDEDQKLESKEKIAIFINELARSGTINLSKIFKTQKAGAGEARRFAQSEEIGEAGASGEYSEDTEEVGANEEFVEYNDGIGEETGDGEAYDESATDEYDEGEASDEDAA